MDQARIQELIEAYKNKDISQADRKSLLHWYSAASEADAVYPDREDEVAVRMLGRLLEDTGYVAPLKKTPKLLRIWWAAAAITVLFVISAYFYIDAKKEQLSDRLANAEVLPGGNRATLTLADGSTVDLSQAQTGIVVGDGGIVYQDGSPVVETKDDNEGPQSVRAPHVSHYVLSTPKGGTYWITLPDGSKVWLNAGSTLKYPPIFTGSTRVVELEGEAFFDVVQRSGSANSIFKVVTKRQVVEVLGTKFNVSAYIDDSDEVTTLVKGAVQLQNSLTGQQRKLAPGQQGILRSGELSVRQVDTDPFVSWKDGKFSFEGKSFVQVMNELSRWYDIEVVYQGAVPEVEFYGAGFRDSNLSLVLRMLQSADLDYRLENRVLTISAKTNN